MLEVKAAAGIQARSPDPPSERPLAPDSVEHPVDHHPVIIPPVPLPGMSRQQRPQPRPLRIAEIMPIQPVIIHSEIQAETGTKDLQDTP